MLTEDVSVPKEHSLTESNVPLRTLTNVSEFKTPTGMEPTASVSQVSQLQQSNVIVKESSWATIVRDAPPSPTLSSKTEFVNVTMDMSK